MFLTKKTIFYEIDSAQTLLINSLSGAFDKVTNDLSFKLKKLQDKESSSEYFDIEPSILEYFKERGYIFNSTEEEDKYLLAIFDKSNVVSQQKPVKFVICPTYSCNLRCIYCYEGDLGSRYSAVMDDMHLEALFSAVDEIKRSRSVRNWLFELFGGEPLSRITKPIVNKIFLKLRALSEPLSIVTNGTNIFDFKDLISEYRDILDFIQVTLDGPKAIHDARRKYASGEGSFDKIVKGIDWLLEEGIQVDLRVNIDNQNISYLPEFVTYIERKNWPFYKSFNCDIAPVTFHTSIVNTKDILTEDKLVQKIFEMFPDLAHMRKIINFGMFRILNYVTSVLEPTREHVIVLPSFHYCEATNHECYVFGPDNYIYACPDSIVNQKYAIGSYYPDLFIDEDKHAHWDRNILNTQKCRECEVATFCGGGCALMSIESGSNEPACNGAMEVLFEYLKANKDKFAQ